MPTVRGKTNHPFIDLILVEGSFNGIRYKSITHACQLNGVDRKRIYACADRGVYRIDIMLELAMTFGVPRDKWLEWVHQYAADIWDAHAVSSKAG